MDKLKVLRSYKLQLNHLGYIVVNGKIADDSAYKGLLRSGKTYYEPLHNQSRGYQYNNLLLRYFKISYKNITIDTIPTYKALILCCAFGKTNKYYKVHKSVSKKLISLGYIKITKLVTGDLLIQDLFNDNVFHTHKEQLYLIKKGKTLKIKL